MRKFYITILLLIQVYMLSAQTLGWQFGVANYDYHNYGVQVAATIADRSKNVVIAGYTLGADTTSGTDSTTFGTNTVYNLNNYQQLIVAKTDSLGNFIFVDATQKTDAWPVNIAADTDGNIYLLGIYDSSNCRIGSYILNNPGYSLMYFLVKFSSSGTVLWAQNVAGQNAVSPYPLIYSGGLGTDASGNVYVAGSFNADSIVIGVDVMYNTSSTGTYDVFLASYDSLGNNIWANTYGVDSNEYVSTMAVANSGDVYLCGTFYDPSFMVGNDTLIDSDALAGLPAGFIAKFDNNDNSVWAQSLSTYFSVNAATTDDTGSVYITGSISSSTSLGGYYLEDTNHHTLDVFVARLDSSGNVKWANSAGGQNSDIATSVSTDTAGNVWISGLMNMGVAYTATHYNMYFGDSVLTEPILGIAPVFLAEYNKAGSYVTSLALASGGGTGNYCGIAVDNEGGFFLGGNYSHINMVFGSDTLLHTDIGQSAFIARYRYAFNLHDTVSDSFSQVNTIIAREPVIILFPNPAGTQCTISCDILYPQGSRAEFYDMAGVLISSNSLSGNSTPIPTGNLSPGIYLCRTILPEYGTYTIKFIIE